MSEPRRHGTLRATAAPGRRFAVSAATWLGLALLALAPTASPGAEAGDGHATTDVPAYDARDPEAAPVTAANLLESERFWPYRAALVRPPRGAAAARPLPDRPPPVGPEGVLIRVEPGGIARIDFGRDGLHAVPVDATDLVERANRIRLGEAEKVAPNFVMAIGPRLLDPQALRVFSLRNAYGYSRFLCVFADPAAEQLAELAKALAPLAEREDVLTIFFPQGRPDDRRVGERLRALGWKVPFVYGHLSEPYTHSLLTDPKSVPAVSLYTAEGRLLFEEKWSADLPAKLAAALGDTTPQTASAAAPEAGAQP